MWYPLPPPPSLDGLISSSCEIHEVRVRKPAVGRIYLERREICITGFSSFWWVVKLTEILFNPEAVLFLSKAKHRNISVAYDHLVVCDTKLENTNFAHFHNKHQRNIS